MNVKTQIKAGNGGDTIIWGNCNLMGPAETDTDPPVSTLKRPVLMSIHFSRSMRRLEADSSRRTIIFFGIIALLIASGRRGSSAPASPFTPRRALHVSKSAGKTIPLMPLSSVASAPRISSPASVSKPATCCSNSTRTRNVWTLRSDRQARPVRPATPLSEDELKAEQRAIDVERRSAEAANAEALAKAQEASTAAELAVEEAKRLSDLQQRGLVSDLEALRGRKQAEERQSEARAAESAAQRVTRDLAAKEQDRSAESHGSITRSPGSKADEARPSPPLIDWTIRSISVRCVRQLPERWRRLRR